MKQHISRYLMTLVALFAMTAGAWADDWTNIVKNSDMEGTDVSCFYVKENAKGAANMYLARITEGIGKEGSRAIKVQSDGKEVETWDTQFFIRLPYELPAGTQYRLSFDYKADKAADADFQCANEPGEYIIWYIGEGDMDDFSFTTDWQNFSKEYTVPAAANGNKHSDGDWLDNFQTIYFSLALNGEATEFIIDNVKVEVLTSDLASLTPSPVTAPDLMNLYVTDNEAKTEASFDMPASDMTVDYELVRDMEVDVNAVMADRIRIKKDGTTYVPVTATELVPVVLDALDEQNPVIMVLYDETDKTGDYTVKLQKKGEGDTPSWTDATTLSVGTFRYVITGANLYDGEITTTEFQLFEGYEVEVAAGEYATFYKDENLYVEDPEAQLYTITSVGTETATATELTVAKANMPILVKNNGQEKKVILLIPTTNQADEVTVASEFVGTLVDATIAASTDDVTNYALNGKQFVWVKDAIPVGANKAWLSIPASNAPALSIVFGGETTSITNTNVPNLTNDAWYDLNGRKLNAKPTTKGVYIMNGRKVVVK